MNKQSISFKADEQKLTKTDGIEHYASNIVAYIEATFDLGTNWNGYDSVRAVWSNDYLTDISTVLDNNGKCIVPTEVLADTGNVTVNLVGSIADGDTLTDRLTTYPCKAVIVDADAKVEGDETESITPSQFEQFVEIVRDEAEQAEADADRAEEAADSIKNLTAEAETLPAGSSASASYDSETGVMTFGIPQGEQGERGADGVTPDIDIGTVETLETGVPAYANITGTVENPSLNLGLPKGNTGDTGATGAPAGFGAVTATIDGTTGTPSVDVTASGADTAKNFAFAFHNLKGEQGEQGEQGEPGVVQDVTVNGTSVVDQNGVAVIKMPELVKTIQGNPIVLDDAFGEVKNLDVELTPVQDLNGYDKPWSGGAGKNLLDSDYAIKFTLNKTITLPKTISANSRIHVHSDGYSYTTPPSSGLKYPYYVFRDADGNNCGAVWGYRDGWLTLSADAVVVQLWSNGYDYAASTGVEVTINGMTISLEEQSSWTPYSNICPITGYDNTIFTDSNGTDTTTTTVTLPHTVYGADVDVIGGEDGKETWGMNDLGDLTWSYNSSVKFFQANISNIPTTSYTGIANAICSNYELGSIASVRDGSTTGIALNSAGYVYVRDLNYTDAQTFSQAMSGVQLCYELATPTDLQTTPTDITLYNGDNVISSDGDMELTYVQDMATVIRKIENQL